MQFSQEIVNGKPKMVFEKHGQTYTRKGFDIRITTAEKFAKKCNALSCTQNHIVEKLIESFCIATGWDQQCKIPPVFEKNEMEHIKQATKDVVEGYFWTLN